MAEPSLDSILDESTPAAFEEAPAAEPAAEAPARDPVEAQTSAKEILRAKEEAAQAEGEGKVRDPATGKYVAKAAPEPVVEKPAAPVQEELTAKEKAFLRSAQEERAKRQQLEERLKALEKPPEPEKPFWDDPEGAMNKMEARVQGVALKTRLDTAEAIARTRHPDYTEKMEVFKDLVGKSPVLWQEALQNGDPAEFAYQRAAAHMDVQEAGGVAALVEKARQEGYAKAKADADVEYKAKAAKTAAERDALPPSLGDARGTPVNKPVFGGPPSLDEILFGS